MFALHHWHRPMTFSEGAARLAVDLEAVLRNFFRGVRAVSRTRRGQHFPTIRWEVRLCSLSMQAVSGCMVCVAAWGLGGCAGCAWMDSLAVVWRWGAVPLMSCQCCWCRCQAMTALPLRSSAPGRWELVAAG